MYKYTRLTTFFLLSCFAFLFLISCNSGKEDKPADGTTPGVKAPPVTESLTTGTLDTLYIDRTAFDTLKNGEKLFFSFTFETTNNLVQHGWIRQPSNRYDSLPNIKLKSGNPSPVTYGVGTYFGNTVLKDNDIAKIKAALTPDMKFVLFAPQLQGSNVGYKILVSNDYYSADIHILAIVDTEVTANPSPPKRD